MRSEFLGIDDVTGDDVFNERALASYAQLGADVDESVDDADEADLGMASSMTPRIVNIVASANLSIKFDLHDVSTQVRNAEWNPRRFSAVILRVTDPKATALVFACGKLNIVGCRNEDDAFKAAKKFGRILKKLNYPVHLREYKVVNIVATIACDFPVRLEALASAPGHKSLAKYNPEVFAGVIYRIPDPRVTLLIFASGKIVMTGAKDRDMLSRAADWVWPILRLFEKRELQVMPDPVPEPVAPIEAPVKEKKKYVDPLFHKVGKRKE
jgi:transcription initiation factor TFIID TATA-box-binding protein